MGASQVGLGCAYSDVAPNYSSALNSVGNTIGSIAGIVGPIVVAAFTEAYPGVWGWRLAFFLTGAMGVVSLSLWHMYQTSKPVPALNTPAPKRV
jgi:MFS family permease